MLERQIRQLLRAERYLPLTIDAYKTAVCRELCTAMCTKLPREIRDIIYSYLVRGEVVVKKKGPVPRTHAILGAGADDAKFFGPGSDGPPYFSEAPRTKSDPLCNEIFWREEITGPVFASGLMYAFYHDQEFVLPWDPDHIYSEEIACAQIDRFRAKHRPRELIRNLVREVAVQDAFEAGRWHAKRHARTIEIHFEKMECFGPQTQVHIRFLQALKPRVSYEKDLKYVLSLMHDGVSSFMRANPDRKVRTSIEHVESISKKDRKCLEGILDDWTTKLIEDARASGSA